LMDFGESGVWRSFCFAKVMAKPGFGP